MGLISRIRRITVSRIENFLNTVEDPEVLFPQLVREMEDQVRAAISAETKALAAHKAAERDAGQIRRKLDRMTRGAEIAVEKGENETARDAIKAQIALESDLKIQDDATSRAERAYQDARNARMQIEEQLDELRTKKNEILTRARIASTQQKIEKTVSGRASSTNSILDAVVRLESKVEEAEAELEIRRSMDTGGVTPSLERRLDELEQNEEIEKRLAELKKKIGDSNG
ncbi:MAG: PspA/IM30 family protein [Acidobacteria bacterium]|jgi:phage shock protein A|nr:PspA/IM30 family protein [Acidobacteriota bacterium]